MHKDKPCKGKAHSGTTSFAPCQVCIDQDYCEAMYQLGESATNNRHTTGGKE